MKYPIYTYKTFKSVPKTLGEQKTFANYMDKVLLEKAYTIPEEGPFIFLSHSSIDDGLILDTINFFKDLDKYVYIDKNDSEMPETTCSDTADILQKRIKRCSRFIVLVTENSKNSKWVPWELGYADGRKRNRDDTIAILPIDHSEDSKWVKQEYLGLYPRIFRHNTEPYVLVPQSGVSTQLRFWLQEQVN